MIAPSFPLPGALSWPFAMIEKKNILIVETAEFQRTMLSRLLESFGASNIVAVATPPGYKGDYDVVFVDASLAEGLDRFRPAAVVVTASDKSDSLAAKRINEGADTFL